MKWQPGCSQEKIQLRAQLLADIRAFFAARAVLEVETPLMGHGIGSDPHLHYFSVDIETDAQQRYLQTSPEFAMKRMLAAGCGSVYQICKAFRNGETGRYHNPEFTLLEWYRLGYDLQQLMVEISDILHALSGGAHLSRDISSYTYAAVFRQYTGLDALRFSLDDYRDCAKRHQLPEAVALCGEAHDLWLDFLFSHLVQPHLGQNGFCLVYEYPACQAALARINPHRPRVAERVELFCNGVELGNGYHELNDAEEQERRFENELQVRRQRNLPVPNKDQRFLAALNAGLPDCAGMAIGLDRLLMVMTGAQAINQVIAFDTENA